MIQWQWNGGLNEQWELLGAGDAPAVTYNVYNVVGPNASPYSVGELDDPNSSASNGTGIELNQPNGGFDQQWMFVPLADGNDLIVNVASGLVLGDPGYSNNDGTQVIQWQLNNGLNEQWQVENLGNGNVEIVNAYSNLALTADPGPFTSDGTPVVQQQWDGGVDQQWQLISPNPAY